jgi:tetratricopeptide (TPR) repeat protein
MLRTLEEKGIDRFLTLYRSDNGLMEQAHRQLGIYYYQTGRHQRAVEHLAFAFIIQTTTLIESQKQRQFDYAFTNFKDLLSTIAKKPELTDYAKQVEYYRTLYYLGAALYAVGVQPTAMEVWKSLETQPGAGEWRDRSILQIKRPHVEAVQEKT